MVNRLLPRARTDDPAAERGADVDLAHRSTLFRAATALTRRAADRYHQRPGPLSAPPPVRAADPDRPDDVDRP